MCSAYKVSGEIYSTKVFLLKRIAAEIYILDTFPFWYKETHLENIMRVTDIYTGSRGSYRGPLIGNRLLLGSLLVDNFQSLFPC